ncbi:MAG TPA: bifunctional demethylmenaquinone methyltransferase/2-methoxy-6-polyprenyl-1,4-benzoquinol methylase UbiE [Candidatus Acidoferrales bacterium]|nr:bifunctional demethylmenaquinone methyltransferase/2-methoxy-6-polyprenyl-1,4-benzoquinol methylase UbiE [Candidatus Acidoferrales bacterium]
MIESKADASARTAATGSRPEGAVTEQQAAERVREMFSSIAPRYDFLNHFLSLNLDRLWRRRVARRFAPLLARPDSRAIDLCCGTGDLTIELLRVSRGTVFGSDFSRPMLQRAELKTVAARPRLTGALGGYIEADALKLPFADASFDLVTNAFGFRNLANYEKGLHEMARILRPGGAIAILEFSQPRSGAFAGLYRLYFTAILPRVGRAISGSTFAYSYLPDSVSKFPPSRTLLQCITNAGLTDANCELWSGGTVALYTAKKS